MVALDDLHEREQLDLAQLQHHRQPDRPLVRSQLVGEPAGERRLVATPLVVPELAQALVGLGSDLDPDPVAEVPVERGDRDLE